MTNKFKNLLYDENDGIGILTLNRESALNALNEEVFVEMREFLEEICKKQLKGLILTGAGDKAFIAGADIKAMQDLSEQEAEDFSYFGQQVTFMLEEIRFPVIAAVNGFALGGGCEMALACDFIPGFGGTQRLAKIVGRNRAKELVYTGRMINSDEAKDIGLVLEVYEDKTLLIEAAKNLLLKMAKNSPHAIGVAKFVINRGVDVSLEEGLKIERSHFGEIFGSKDMQEGTKAFIERKPVFTGE
jgi:enoyl-CoA hydratase